MRLRGERVRSPKRVRGRRHAVRAEQRFGILARSLAALQQRPGVGILGPVAPLAQLHFFAEALAQEVCHAPCEAVSHREELPRRLLEARTLEIHAAGAVDQPDRYAIPSPDVFDAALHNGAGAQRPSDTIRCDCCALVGRDPVLRNHGERRYLGERGNQLLGQPVGEISQIFLRAQVLEVLHRDAPRIESVCAGAGPCTPPAKHAPSRDCYHDDDARQHHAARHTGPPRRRPRHPSHRPAGRRRLLQRLGVERRRGKPVCRHLRQRSQDRVFDAVRNRGPHDRRRRHRVE